MSDPYEREAAKAAIQTLERELQRIKTLAESNGKLAHDSSIEAMWYRDDLVKVTKQRDALQKMVVNFCKEQEWVAKMWNEQDYIKPLFEFAESLKGGSDD